MKICFCGTQCADKTTGLLYVAAELKIRGFDVEVIQEYARKNRYPINKGGTFQSQLWILLKQMLEENRLESKGQIVLCDRGVVDPFIYYSYLTNGGHVDKAQLDFIGDVADLWMKLCPYDAVFVMHPLPIKADVDRPADTEFQAEIDRRFQIYFSTNPAEIKSEIFHVNQINRDERRKFVLAKVLELIQQ